MMKLTEITVARTIPAFADKAFDVWINPKSPGEPWFGAERVILNPVIDGLFYFAVKHEGRTWAHYGCFLQIDRPYRVESIVIVTIEARGEETGGTLRHAGVPDDDMGRQHEAGWPGCCPRSRKASAHGGRLLRLTRRVTGRFAGVFSAEGKEGRNDETTRLS
jgi:Activator of Hsp90 ATPase homolog 1-like protein